MTSPDFAAPAQAQIASAVATFYQNADPEALAAIENGDLRAALEFVRNQLWNGLLGGFENVSAAVWDGMKTIMEAITGLANAGLAEVSAWAQSIRNQLQEIIDGIFNGFANMGELLDFSRPINDVIDTIANLLGMGMNTQSIVSTHDAQIRLLQSAGNTIVDSFERASGGLGSNYQLFHAWSGGGGSVGVDGRGNAVWKPSGGSTRGLLYRHMTGGVPSQITTDSCVVGVALASDPPDAGSPGAFTYLPFSVSASSEVSYGRLRIGRSKVAVEAVVSGTVTVLAEQEIHPRGGQTIELIRGNPGSTDLGIYTVKRNGTPIWEFEDHLSRIKSGAGFRGTGFGMQAASREIVPIFLYEQWLPAAAGVITYAEVL